MVSELMKYEEIAVTFYGNDVQGVERPLTDPTREDLRGALLDTEKSQRNPYRDAALWVKGEYLDLKGMQEALMSRE